MKKARGTRQEAKGTRHKARSEEEAGAMECSIAPVCVDEGRGVEALLEVEWRGAISGGGG